MPPKFAPRKLLVAAVGVATLNYMAAACTPSPPTSGNLMVPPDDAASPTPVDAAAPVDAAPPADAAPPKKKTPPSGKRPPGPPPTSGNLMSPD